MFTDTHTSSPRNSTSGISQQEENSAPMMAVFGGMFALMLVFLVVVNVVSEAAVRERISESTTEGHYRIERMDGSSGYSVIVFPEALRIVETAEGVARDDICQPGSAFRRYAERIYGEGDDQLLFFLLEGSIPTMTVARNCLYNMWPYRPLRIGWVIADNEFLKSVMLDDIPEYIQDHVEDLP